MLKVEFFLVTIMLFLLTSAQESEDLWVEEEPFECRVSFLDENNKTAANETLDIGMPYTSINELNKTGKIQNIKAEGPYCRVCFAFLYQPSDFIEVMGSPQGDGLVYSLKISELDLDNFYSTNNPQQNMDKWSEIISAYRISCLQD